MNIKLTIFFEEPFWVGVFERTDGEMLQTAKVVFGSEPKDYEKRKEECKKLSKEKREEIGEIKFKKRQDKKKKRKKVINRLGEYREYHPKVLWINMG